MKNESPDAPKKIGFFNLLVCFYLIYIWAKAFAAGNLNALRWIALALGVFGVVSELRKLRTRRAKTIAADAEEEGDEQPIRSLVFLLSEPREIEPGGQWIEQLGNVLGRKLNAIEDEDEQLEAAKEEAKRRWPEFVSLFQNRDTSKESPFIVKAPFSDKEKTEFMWVEVAGLDAEILTGVLMNTPHQLVGFREGQNVAIPTDSIVDWLCVGSDGNRLGGWTQDVLMRHANRGSSGR